jgi:capsular exopolysaccharide synthesis family protein
MEDNLTGRLSDLPDYRDILSKYTRHWLWFVIAIVAALASAGLYIRYTNPTYEAKAKIRIIGDENSSSELSVMKDIDFLAGDESKVEDEIEDVNARSNFIEVVENLRLNIKVIALGKIKDRELYANSPIQISFISPDSLIGNSRADFYINLTSDAAISFKEMEDEPYEIVEFGKNMMTSLGEVVITPNLAFLKKHRGGDLKIEVRPVVQVAETYREKTVIKPAFKQSKVLDLSLNDPVQEKAVHILSELIQIYNQNAVKDRREIADRTSTFIEERIEFIYGNLTNVDQTEENFRTSRGLTDMESEANINLNVGAATQQQLNNTRTELNIAESMRDIIKSDGEYDLLPANIGLSDATISSTTAKYNQLISERNRLLKSSNEKNPIIVNLNQELNGLKRIMESSLNGMIKNLDLQVAGLSKQQSRVNYKIYSAPKNQRALRDITRKQQTTEQLYLYLLTSREQAQIAFASSKPISKVIDKPYAASELPISPKKPIVFLGSLLLAFIIPFSVIFIRDILDNKVKSRLSLEKIIGEIPVLGELPKIKKAADRIVKKDDRSALAESLRIISTNLDYILNQGDVKNNVIFVTSSVPGEGKTFVSSNLALILGGAISGKACLIGADIRNPQIDTFFSTNETKNSKTQKNTLGLTDFLSNSKWTVKDVTTAMKTNSGSIDVIHSGKIPPNPAELLKSPRVKELLDIVRDEYDYVIVDTAPIMLVSDTLRLSEFADHTIYVAKAGSTETKLLEYPIRLVKEKKLKNLSFVVNNVKATNLGYYGKYGYGY